MDDFFEDGFEEGFEGDWEDFDDGGYDSDYEDRFFEENFNYDGDSTGFEDEHLSREEQQADEPWISPVEASIMGYGFGLEEGLDERRRRRQQRQDARIEEFRRRKRRYWDIDF